ncbi:MAG: DNA-3-methyladenine glycosylase I [Rectinema sp.]|nr:DNA-3-methyladenine glycosylase I [Rectinema sp.]
MNRCPWCGTDPVYVRYHDEEWGRPVHDEQLHFEFLLLETQQAGLSWRTILGKREAYRAAFSGFDPAIIARYSTVEIESMLQNPSLIRNRRKLEAAIANARAFLSIQEKHGSFDQWIWRFVDGMPIVNTWKDMREIPVRTPLSDRISEEMRSNGFRFVGSVTIYAHMQAIGLVNDHLIDCFRHAELAGAMNREL